MRIDATNPVGVGTINGVAYCVSNKRAVEGAGLVAAPAGRHARNDNFNAIPLLHLYREDENQNVASRCILLVVQRFATVTDINRVSAIVTNAVPGNRSIR